MSITDRPIDMAVHVETVTTAAQMVGQKQGHRLALARHVEALCGGDPLG